MALRFLVVEGNTAEGRDNFRTAFGKTAGESYSEVLGALAPDSSCDICHAADADAEAPAALAEYDGVFATGSALNLYVGGPAIERQIALARAVFASGTPFFGSCWGLQVACAAAGGRVYKNPRGRQLGVARNIWMTEAGLGHPLLRGRPRAYEALCSHLDVVELPECGVALASSETAPVQAAEIRHEGGVFWGVQYHPEFTFAKVAAIIERRAAAFASEGFAGEGTARDYAQELRLLDAEPPPGLAWRLGLTANTTTREARALELTNFIETRVRPTKSARGRA